jgi:hypothetical protein
MNCLAIQVFQRGISNPFYTLDNCRIHNEDGQLSPCIAHRHRSKDINLYSPLMNPIKGCLGHAHHRIQNLFATTLRPQRLN